MFFIAFLNKAMRQTLRLHKRSLYLLRYVPDVIRLASVYHTNMDRQSTTQTWIVSLPHHINECREIVTAAFIDFIRSLVSTHIKGYLLCSEQNKSALHGFYLNSGM